MLDPSPPPQTTTVEMPDEAFTAISQKMQTLYGIHLPPEKKPLVHSRLTRRLRDLRLGSFDAYLKYVDADRTQAEQREMLAALTTNVTSFFREAHHFELLKTHLFNRQLSSSEPVKIWSAGCSTGAEPLSIAVTWLQNGGAPDGLKILATDVDHRVLTKAQQATYSTQELQGLSDVLRDRYFLRRPDKTWAANDTLLGMISYRHLNLIAPFPFSGKFDAIFCRNVAIYFDDAVQAQVWAALVRSLAPKGYLFIGHSERLDAQTALRVKNIGITAYENASTGD